MSLKVVPFKSLGAASYSPSVAVCDIFSVKEWPHQADFENRVSIGFVQGHWKWHQLIDRIRV